MAVSLKFAQDSQKASLWREPLPKQWPPHLDMNSTVRDIALDKTRLCLCQQDCQLDAPFFGLHDMHLKSNVRGK